MATFSPDTTVKETVNVNYHDRITGQKVVMINRENEFYGTFKGVSELSGSTFVDPTIEGGTLHGTKIVDDDGKVLNLSEYAQAIYDLEQVDDDIRSEFADADIALYNRIKAESGESSGGAAKEACDALSVELVGKMELADEALKSQMEAHETLSEEKFTSVENRLTESSARIDIVDGKAEENKASITELENAIRDIKAESAGGLMYRGSVNIEADTETFGDMIESLEGSGEVKTGYMYSVRAEADAPEKIEDKKVGSGDMIILKNITGTKTASAIRKLNVEIIDAMDKNILQRVDNALTRMEEIEAAIGGIGGFATKEEVNTVRADLQTTYQSLHDEIGSVSSTLHNSIDNVNDRISGVDARIDNTHDELQTKVDEAAIISEANERREADNDIRTSITGFQSAVDALNDRVDTVQSGLENVETELEAETTRAESVESSLNSRINSEEARALAVETDLVSRFEYCNNQINTEVARAQEVETDLASRIEGCNANIVAEVSRATDQESAIKYSLDEEVTRAKVAEAELESLITAEQTARGNGDIDLGNRMTDMYSDLTGYIDEEALARKTADEELDAKFDLALTQEIEDRQNGDLEIKHDLIGSMKYVGHITLSCDDSGTPTQTLREMFHDYLENSLKVDPDTYPLKNGWIYQVTIDTELTGQSLATLLVGDGTDESFEIWDRDYIVIHKRENMVDLTSDYDPSVLWNELSRENIDIIDAMDDNVVVEEQLSAAIQTERERAIYAENELNSSLGAVRNYAEEQAAALGAGLVSANKSIGTLATTLNTAIANETERAIGAESSLDSQIMAERDRAQIAEIDLGSRITDCDNRIRTEEETRANDDDYLSGRIDDLQDNFKYYEAERYTAYEVLANSVAIPAGTSLTATDTSFGDGVTGSIIDGVRCADDANLSVLTPMTLPTAIPVGMTETFQLRCIPAYIEDTKALNVWVSWGDGATTKISDDGVVTSDSPRTDASGIGYTLAHFTHTYTKPGKYIIEVHGNGYYGFFRYTSLTNTTTVNTLMSRVLDYDLPISHDLTNFTNLALGAKRLIYVRLPSHVNWLEGIQNGSKGFANCTNLIVAKGFFNLLWHARLSNFFLGCTNLKYCDLRLNGYPTYKNKVGDGNISVFDGCENLEGDIAQFLPVEGFASRVVNVDRCFYHCKKLRFDSLSCGANAGKNNEIWAGTATTPKILWGDTAKLWKSANVFGNNTTDILNNMPNLSGYVDLIPVSWGGRKPDNMAIDTAASEVLAEVANYELDPSGYTMDDFVGLLSSFMDKIS